MDWSFGNKRMSFFKIFLFPSIANAIIESLGVLFPAACGDVKNIFLVDTPSACGGVIHFFPQILLEDKVYFIRVIIRTCAKDGLMGRQAVEKAIESLYERKSDSFELLSVKALIIK
jgi:hypothetical protein